MAISKPNLDIDRLHALAGRMQSHTDELMGRPELPPGIAKDVQTVTAILTGLTDFLAAVGGHLPPGDLPEASRSSHYSG